MDGRVETRKLSELKWQVEAARSFVFVYLSHGRSGQTHVAAATTVPAGVWGGFFFANLGTGPPGRVAAC